VKSDIQMADIEFNQTTILYLITAIVSLICAILMFATDFLGYYIYPDEWYYVHAGTAIYGPIIVMVGIFLFICTFISAVGFYNPKFITKRTLQLGLLLSGIVFLMTIIGILIAAGDLADTDDWWVEAGFYGALLGGIFTTALLFGNYWLQYIREGAPKGVAELRKIQEDIPAEIAVPEINHCSKCGKPASGQFCTYCGTKMF